MEELIISISGLRGLVGENFFEETAADFGRAFGTFLHHSSTEEKRPSLAVGRDSRPSGAMLFSAFASGLCAAGVDVIDLGLCSTPAVGVMLRVLDCSGGAVITASHNPLPYNGIKLLLADGVAPAKPIAEKIKKIFLDKNFICRDPADCGRLSSDSRSAEIHVKKVLSIVQPHRIAQKKFTVVLDSVNGAGGPEGTLLLEKLGCNVIGINQKPTGLFAHTPEPTRENLTSLCRAVSEHKADIGFAQDPDADRLAVVDGAGRYIGEEFTLALAAKYVFASNPGVAAANLSTSRMIDDVAAAAGGKVIRTPVGEANVAAAMIKNNCVIGGEGNGGVIDLRVGPIRDSLVAVAMILDLMAQTGKIVGDLADEIGGYQMYKTKYRSDAQQAKTIIEKTKKIFPDAQLNTSDGCRFDFHDGWLHIRTSNTEPIMRVILETKDPAAARQYLNTIESLCKDVLK